jgi:hypothetical protein
MHKMTLRELQLLLVPWVERNFPNRPWQMPLMGISEEVGELNHALLKQWQAIRGTPEQHEAKAKDAVGDIIIFLLDLCNARGWDIQAIIDETWGQVSHRDWITDPQDGNHV